MCFLVVIIGIASLFYNTSKQSNDVLITQGHASVASFFNNMGIALIIIPVLLVGVYFFFILPTKAKEERLRAENAEKKDELIYEIYNRLRYVERDHVVFDPVSKKQSPAIKDQIMALAEFIIENETVKGE